MVTGRLLGRVGIRRMYLFGLSAMILGTIGYCFAGEDTSLVLIGVFFAVRSMGVGALLMNTVTWGMSRTEKEHVSDGTALISSLRTVAGAMGQALFVSVMSAVAAGQTGLNMIPDFRAAMAGVNALLVLMLVISLLKVKE